MPCYPLLPCSIEFCQMCAQVVGGWLLPALLNAFSCAPACLDFLFWRRKRVWYSFSQLAWSENFKNTDSQSLPQNVLVQEVWNGNGGYSVVHISQVVLIMGDLGKQCFRSMLFKAHLDILVPCSCWCCRSEVGPGMRHFSCAVRWCSYCCPQTALRNCSY